MPLDLSKLQGVKRAQNGAITARCPACAEDGRDHTGDHLVVYPDGRYGCLTCPGAEGEDHRKRIWALAGDGSPDGAASGYVCQNVTPQIEIERTWPASVLDRLVKDHSYWVNRGVKESVIVAMRGGVATEFQMKGRYVFPIFNQNGEIIGFAGRALDPKQELRWKHLGKVSTWVWANLEEIAAQEEAFLVEGAGCRLALESRDITTSIPLWGVNLSPAVLAALIAANPKRIHVCTNNDQKHDVGQRAAAKIKATLDKFFDEGVTTVDLPPAKDFLDKAMTEEKWAEWRAALESTESIQKET
jgi:hypothetical protein